MFIRTKIFPSVHDSIAQHSNTKPLLEAINAQFKSSEKVCAMILIMKFSSFKFTSVRGMYEHIMKMGDITSQLKNLEIEILEHFLVYYILNIPLQ